MAAFGLIQEGPDGNPVVTTETAVTAFGLLAGVGGAAQQLIASRKLGTISGDSLSLRQLGVPIAISVAGSVLGSLFLPGTLGR